MSRLELPFINALQCQFAIFTVLFRKICGASATWLAVNSCVHASNTVVAHDEKETIQYRAVALV
jgi:hypothetical protein